MRRGKNGSHLYLISPRWSRPKTVWSLCDISISQVSAPSVRKANLAQAPTDHWVFTYSRQGETKVQTPKGEFGAAGGVPFQWSFGEPFGSKRTRVGRTRILRSRGAFYELAAERRSKSRGAGCLATIFLPWSDGCRSKETNAPRLTAAARNMVAACILPLAEHGIVAREQIDSGLSERVRRIIEARNEMEMEVEVFRFADLFTGSRK